MKELPNETPSLLPCREDFGEEIRQVETRIDIRSAPFITSASFTDEVIRYRIHLLLEGRSRHGCVCQHRLVVAVDKGRILTPDPHHSKLVPQSTHVFGSLLHCGQFKTIRADLAARLLLA